MIDINTLVIGQSCPCGFGVLADVDLAHDYFVCLDPQKRYTGHHPMPASGPGFYTNLTNVSVTPPRVSLRQARRRAGFGSPPPLNSAVCGGYSIGDWPVAKPAVDRAKFPHDCPKCRDACYVGFTDLEHASTGTARCP